MKKTMEKMSVAIGAAVILISGLVLAAEIPASKDTITLNLIEGKKGPVEFPHKKHVTEFKKKGGAAIVCKDCHHTLKSDKEMPKPCQECHVKVGEAEKTIDGKKAPPLAVAKSDGKIEQKSVIFHKTCLDGCHKEMKDEVKKKDGKNITACKTCHNK